MSGPRLAYDRADSKIGRPTTRPDAIRLTKGRGQYVDDLVLPRMVHAAFVRSPYAHAEIRAIDAVGAKAAPGVLAVYTGADIAAHVKPYVAVLSHLKGLRSAPQYPLAVDRARWQGEPVAMVVARTRAEAEDAAELVGVDYEVLPAACDFTRALEPDEPVIHPEFGSNLAFERTIDVGDVDAAFSEEGVTVVRRTFRFGRHTGVTLEPRGTVGEWDPGSNRLTMHYSGQTPHMMQSILAEHLALDEADVRVVARDVGGSFGIKIHTYGDEIATCVAARLLERPVKFIADRAESFVSDIHARDHVVEGALGMRADGTIVGIEIDDLTGIGPYSVYPRTSAIECNQVLNVTGAPYKLTNYRARGRVVFQNKAPMCQYRAVGHPIAMAVADGLLDEAAATLGLDPLEVRRLNLIADDAYPVVTASGMKLDDLSQHRTLARLAEVMDYESLRAEQARQREAGVHRGIGLVAMIEMTNPGPHFYGIGGAPIASQDGAVVRLDSGGTLHVASSVTEQGQGANAMLAQVVASVFGGETAAVRVTTGDTDTVPVGGGTWASRGTGIGGEAALLAANALKEQILDVAAVMLQSEPGALDIAGGAVVDASGAPRITLRELARTVYFRGNELPADLKPELVASRHFRVTDVPFVFTNSAMAAHVEVDIETGLVTILDFWAVEDCGRVVNPKLVDAQVRGGVVQGIGGALFEECLYSPDGQMLNATMADYLVPMAVEMPDITVAHIETPTKTSVLGAKGAGEAGTGGAPAALMNAINDALRPLGGRIDQMPMTPERILKALGTV